VQQDRNGHTLHEYPLADPQREIPEEKSPKRNPRRGPEEKSPKRAGREIPEEKSPKRAGRPGPYPT